MRPLHSLISLDQAKSLVRQGTPLIDRTESVGIECAVRRVLAQEVVSSIDIPPFDRAAMDGYAVRAEDTFRAGKFDPVELGCVGVIHAGQVPKGAVAAGQCMQIATGAMLPRMADAVVKVEDTEREGRTVRIYRPVYPSANVSKRGEDVTEGSTVLSAGDYLVPSKVGVLAALGIAEIDVFERPRVSIIPTGNEVAPVGGELKEGQVYDINSHTLSSIVQENGGLSVIRPIVEDTKEALETIVGEAAETSDMIVLSGGSSAGERDVLEEVVAGMGEVIFHGVQIKPGKPTLFGRVKGRPLFGMPGYPTACLTNGYVFLVDSLRRLARLPPRREIVLRVPLAKRYSAQLGRHQFLTVRIEGGKAVPVFKESGAITSIAYADGWVEIPPNVDMLERGTEVEVHFFQ